MAGSGYSMEQPYIWGHNLPETAGFPRLSVGAVADGAAGRFLDFA